MNFLIIQGGRKALGPLGSGGAQPGSALRRAPITPSQVLCGQLCGGARTAGPPPVSAAGIRLTVRGFGTAEPHAAESQASALQFSWRRAPNAEEAALAVPVPRLTGRGWVLPTPPLKADYRSPFRARTTNAPAIECSIYHRRSARRWAGR
ncbi:uncharacterized protein LOC121441686 isoform X2 [Microtus oregoni]|uniref:uncharacterized protein LOC121441686 isoform X2 n=1 Tax=Microtus oregoni TaxID=111838 RepID=UPI001BB279A4|nr:uncharacterized protein LOC121441686 isoform X2 [Microtus oregoni]